MEVYILTESFDSYEDQYTIVDGVFSDKDFVIQKAKDIAKHYHIDIKSLPMSFTEWRKCNYGHRDDKDRPIDFNTWSVGDKNKWQSEFIDRDGYIKEEFAQMDAAYQIQSKSFNYCIIDTYEIDGGKCKESILFYSDGTTHVNIPKNND